MYMCCMWPDGSCVERLIRDTRKRRKKCEVYLFAKTFLIVPVPWYTICTKEMPCQCLAFQEKGR